MIGSLVIASDANDDVDVGRRWIVCLGEMRVGGMLMWLGVSCLSVLFV